MSHSHGEHQHSAIEATEIFLMKLGKFLMYNLWNSRTPHPNHLLDSRGGGAGMEVRLECSLLPPTVPEDDFGQGLTSPGNTAHGALPLNRQRVNPLKVNPLVAGDGHSLWEGEEGRKEGKRKTREDKDRKDRLSSVVRKQASKQLETLTATIL